MLKKFLLCNLFWLMTTLVFADEMKAECESAVDAADRLGSNANGDCDYSNTGLNGVLHRAIANKEKVSTNKKVDTETKIEKLDVAASRESVKATADTVTAKAILPHVVSAEFGVAQQLVSVRYELIRKAARECAKGFVLDKERYLPTETQLLQLELTYSCL